ncbi:hypothetical protein C8R45DRAFT_807317, partial [Mycena sanguinolenta]
RPVCGPCLRASRQEDCEYIDNLGRSRAERLEEDISQIQTRIYQLEHPEVSNPSVSLRDPYAAVRVHAQIPGIHQMLSGPMLSSASMSTELESGTVSDSWWNSDEPPKHMAQSFLETFLPYAWDWGFFLDIENFRRDALLSLPIGHYSRPSSALLAAVYLGGITLTVSPTLKMREKTFLARALSALPSSLSGTHPHKAIHALQSEIILATYFFSGGKFVEGMYHTAAAVSLAVGNGLLQTVNEVSDSPGRRAMDSEETERFDAFWTIITLDKAWAMALGTPSNLNDTLIPPRSLETWANENVSIDEMAPTTLLAKAVLLWERASKLAAQWNPDSFGFFGAFNTLEEQIDHFRRAVTAFTGENHGARPLIVVYSIAHTAAIQLHSPFENENSHHKRVDAAKAVLAAVADANLVDCVFINPIVAPLWAAACRVVIEEIHVQEGNSKLSAAFERGFTAMRGYAVCCPLLCTFYLHCVLLLSQIMSRSSSRADPGSLQRVGRTLRRCNDRALILGIDTGI